MKRPHLTLDLETRSAVDLRQTGVYRYAADATTDVWVGSYAVDDGPIKRWHPGQPVPAEIIQAVAEGWEIHAHNAQFERILWKFVLAPRYGWPEPKLEQWRCSMVCATAMSLPASLEKLVAALGLDIRKDMAGNRLMKRMMKPRKPRKAEKDQDGKVLTGLGDEHGLLWWDDPERIERLSEYCDQDVAAERESETRLLPLSDTEQQLWFLDQRINDRGVGVDKELADAALHVVQKHTTKLNTELKELTGGAVFAGTNVEQIKEWLANRGIETESLDKEAVGFLLTRPEVIASPAITRVLQIRREVGKASVKKINAILKGRDDDGRARGLLQFHAASTGRWGGRRFQPQNLKRPDIKDVGAAIRLILLKDASSLELAYGDVLSVVGDVLRGLIAATAPAALFASDFSNIEGRGLAWIAGEEWKLNAFRAFDRGEGPDLYRLAYSRAFGIPVEAVDDVLRQIGKVMELALGYEGGVGAFQTMASAFGLVIPDKEADDLKKLWRAAHPATKQFWKDLIDAAIRAVAKPGSFVDLAGGKLRFLKNGSFLFMRLPSGRVLTYPYPRLVEMVWVEDAATGKRRPIPLERAQAINAATPGALKFDEQETSRTVVYKGVDAYTKKWGDIYLYGGMLAENAVQALSRDALAEAMLRVEAAGYPIVLTVHDEIVSEREGGSFEEFNALMRVVPAWAEGFPIVAAGWTGERYRK